MVTVLHALFCWDCFCLQSHEEIRENVFKCRVCGHVRDLTDPDELAGVAGD